MFPLISCLGFEIPTYLLINSLTFSLGIYLVFKRAENDSRYNTKLALDICLAAMIGGFIGARLFHVVFEHPEVYLADPAGIFKVWNGGFVFYGGLAGGFAAGAFVCKLRKSSVPLYGDLLAPILALGYGLGRIGCLTAGCCFGKPTTLPWAAHFPPGVEAPPYIGLHPTQIYSTLWSFGLFLLLRHWEKTKRWTIPGQIFGWWLVIQSIGRIIIEQFRDDFRGPSVFNLSISVWLSFVTLGLGLRMINQQRKS